MSYDLEIATHQKPELADLKDVLPEGTTLSGTFGAKGSLVVKGGRWSCEIDGPFQCEPYELQPALAHAVVAPAWLMQLHVPVSDPKVARESAARIATHVARTRRGAVYDPQQDRVVFPKGGKRPVPHRATDSLSRTLRCEWCYSPEVLASKAGPFLDLLELLLPEAVPRRFGTFEPLQHRFDSGRDHFLRMWKAESASSGSFFWTCKRPGVGGGVGWPFDNENNAKLGGLPAARLLVELEGELVLTDEQWRSATTAFFRAVSSRTEAFYGRAILSPPAPALITASDLESLSTPAAVFRGRWHGVPRHPAWLTWLGPAYPGRVALTRPSAPEGLFVQDANLDAKSDVLLPDLPPALYRVQRNADLAATREKLVSHTAFVDAEWLRFGRTALP